MQRIPKDFMPSVMLHRQKYTYLWGWDGVTILLVHKKAMQRLVSGMQLPTMKLSQELQHIILSFINMIVNDLLYHYSIIMSMMSIIELFNSLGRAFKQESVCS